ncbi:MobA-like NTP transferase protein [Hephaestia caeni]|uniref:MobA-like NTP transferase protein n=1 Tax=Hephaestia caeni TaxID=645617 RepID=A0A397NM10_9SPHN|nr:MobA-like NTP transferase protein [Hephaestia caeni]
MSFNALVLAGSRGGPDPVAAYAGVSDKALIEIDGETMLARVVGALRAAGAARIGVSASAPAVIEAARALGTEIVPAAPGPSQSAAVGLAALGTPLLLTTADHALLRPEWVRDFLNHVPADADVAVLLARREAIEAAAPATRRTYLRFADGDWSGCNLFHFASPRAVAAIDLWRHVEADRKRPWRIVRRLGPGLLLRYLVRRLTLADAVAHLGRRAGVAARVVAAEDGRAAIDVDKPDDLDLVRQLVARGG